MKTIQEWLLEYGESHQNQINKKIHWVCVPAIFFSVIGFLYALKLPWYINTFQLNIAVPAIFLLLVYYTKLSGKIAIAMFLIATVCLGLCFLWDQAALFSLSRLCLSVFIVAWIFQFYGHHIEGKKPSFLKDLQFLLIGPAWLISFLFQRMNIKL